VDADIQSKISEIMSDPEAMEQVKSLGKMLGLSPEQPEPSEPEDPLSGEIIAKLTSLAPMLRKTGEDDDAARLLSALRPFLGEEKRRKLDSAKRMLRILRLLPVIRDSGILF
jgi:hypothetical protein